MVLPVLACGLGTHTGARKRNGRVWSYHLLICNGTEQTEYHEVCPQNDHRYDGGENENARYVLVNLHGDLS